MFTYQKCSGQLVNKSKSCFLTPTWCPPARRAVVARLAGFSFKAFPIKYLGCPLFVGRKVCSLFTGMVDSITARIKSWSSKWLSFGGRLVLLNSVLLSLPVYLLSVMNPPKGVISTIHRVLGNFLWGSADGKQRRH